MTNTLQEDEVLFTLLSMMNWYNRVVVGDSTGNIFTLSYRKWQELVDAKAFATAVSGWDVDFLLPWHMESTLQANWIPKISRPLKIILWSEPILGLGVVCAWESYKKQWYLWAPTILMFNDTNGLDGSPQMCMSQIE